MTENRKYIFGGLLPETKLLILGLYGTYEAFINATNIDNNPHRNLEEACILYDRSSEYENCALQGLKLLGLDANDVLIDPTVTLYNALGNIIHCKNNDMQ